MDERAKLRTGGLLVFTEAETEKEMDCGRLRRTRKQLAGASVSPYKSTTAVAAEAIVAIAVLLFLLTNVTLLVRRYENIQNSSNHILIKEYLRK